MKTHLSLENMHFRLNQIIDCNTEFRTEINNPAIQCVDGESVRTRRHPSIELGCSPRAGIALIKASRARALIHGRGYVVPDDLFALAEDVMLHRTRLNYEALADGKTGAGVLYEILHEIGAVPTDGRPVSAASRRWGR